MPRAVSDITREVNRAFLLIGGVCILLLIGITFVMIPFVARYRRGRSRTTSQVEGHLWLEITWTVIPTLIVTWMFFVGYRGFSMIRGVPRDAMLVQVTGRQWSWSFHYPDSDIDAAELVVPVNRPVRLELTAPPTDVNHSFYIPDIRVKEDVIPGRETHLWFKADRPGTHDIFCAEFCGKDHSKMLAQLRVLSAEDYTRWMKREQSKKYQPLFFEAITNPNLETFGPAGLNIDARALYQTFCASCHAAAGDGSGLPGQARNFTSPDGWKRSPKVTDVFRTLMEGVPGTQMRAYPNFTPWQRVALGHYVRHFMKPTPPADTRQDFDALVKEYELDKIQPPSQPLPIDQAMKLLIQEGTAPSTSPATAP